MNTVSSCLRSVKKVESFRDFRDFVDFCAEAHPENDAFIIKNTINKTVSYRHVRFPEMRDDVYALGTALMRRDWSNKTIAVIGINSYEWMLVYLAVLCNGGSIVPLDKGLPFEEFEMSVSRSEADIVFYGKGYLDFVEKLPKNVTAIPMNEDEAPLSLSSLLNEGRQAPAEEKAAFAKIEIDTLRPSIIIFTSGTTSMAKAVMLSQHNVLSNIKDVAETEDIRDTDVNIAFLPFHHTFGATGQLFMLCMGAATVFCDGLKYIQKNLVEYGVSVFVSVPLIIESMYKRIIAAAEKNGKMKKLRFAGALSGFLMKLHIDIRRKLFKTVIDQLGGNLRLIINGAAAINPEVLKGMTAFGIETIQGYGMTESSPVLCAENMENRRAGSVGKALPSVRVKIVEPNDEGVGELIACGPNVMQCYMNNKKDTSAVLKDGWLYTGDLAHIDDDGFVFLRGRKKNVIVLKSGKNVYPEELEKLFDDLPYVSESMVFAHSRKGNDDDADLALVAKIYCEGEDVEAIRPRAEADLNAINEDLPKYKRIHRLIISEKPMIKTTTGKIKRFEEIQLSGE